ncbi:ATP-dependent DNA ligase [Streptomyces sp. NPDC047072]|uniref:ATP-dependent DNA ligase n=1 Tax=Streptomyces sp. NPDC047072 TaxID=3154809 RepID=UPI0033C1D545
MRLSPPLEPMLARSVTALPPAGGRTALFEPKVDGYRTIVFARPTPHLQSRRGADLTGAFPELARAAAALGTEAVFDAELVVENAGRLDFAALQQRARRRGAAAEHAARAQPAQLVVFDLLEVADALLIQEPLRRRRAALEELFAARRLPVSWTLCPQTADPDAARAWLAPAWGTVGVEGVMIKDPGAAYEPGQRGWSKLKARTTTEAIIGAVTGTPRSPTSLLLGRLDAAGCLAMIARSTLLPRAAAAELGAVLRPAGPEHPWQGRRFSAGWGTSEPLVFQTVVPELVAEVVADTAVDRGRYRHPVRYLRLRGDMAPGDVRG